MLNKIKKLFTTDQIPEEVVDIQNIIHQIKEKESAQTTALGRRIHSFSYQYFQLYLDRDITKNYRITVYQGRDRIYSFTIFAKQGKYDILERGYSRIISFLDSERRIADLPDDDILKGFFYGH